MLMGLHTKPFCSMFLSLLRPPALVALVALVPNHSTPTLMVHHVISNLLATSCFEMLLFLKPVPASCFFSACHLLTLLQQSTTT